MHREHSPIGQGVTSYPELVRRTLNILSEALQPFVQGELRRAYPERWEQVLEESLGSARPRDGGKWDAYALLNLIWEQWRPVFRDSLTSHDRNLVSELRHYRNRWAHQEDFSFDDAYRVLDDARRLLLSVGATDQMTALELEKESLIGSLKDGGRFRTRSSPHPVELLTFVICGAALGMQVALSFGERAWPFAVLSAVSFSYILIRRLIRDFGERCPACGSAPLKDEKEPTVELAPETPDVSGS